VANLKADGQWIIMMGFLVSLGIFYLAVIISQSTLVGQTTAEGVLEFPKNDIQDLRHDILEVENFYLTQCQSGCGNTMSDINMEIQQISLYRKSAIVSYNLSPCNNGVSQVSIYYDNGVTTYNESSITVDC